MNIKEDPTSCSSPCGKTNCGDLLQTHITYHNRQNIDNSYNSTLSYCFFFYKCVVSLVIDSWQMKTSTFLAPQKEKLINGGDEEEKAI